MTPVTLALAAELGVDPRPLVIALMIGASACFATPIGYQTNTIVYAAGDYRFVDFVKIGVPLNIIPGVSPCLANLFFLTCPAAVSPFRPAARHVWKECVSTCSS